MIKIIGAIFRYSLLVLVILVLSHIIQIRGTTISDHVLNAMNFIGGSHPEAQGRKLVREYSHHLEAKLNALRKVDPEISADDEKALDQLIQRSQKHK